MGTKVNSNYESLLTFTRASKGHALRPVSYGDELSEGSDFSSWDNNSTFPFDTFTVGSSSLTVANSTGKTSVVSHPDSIYLVSGRLYVVDVLLMYLNQPYSQLILHIIDHKQIYDWIAST